MMYLLDANVLIRANEDYYPLNAVPEYWTWLKHMGTTGKVKIPREIFDEVMKGPKEDPLCAWITETETKKAMILEESPSGSLIREVLSTGYAPDLTDTELDKIGMDPILISYAAMQPRRRVVTCENSAPKKIRANRKIPDVCASMKISWCTPFEFTKQLGFRTNWSAFILNGQFHGNPRSTATA